MSEDINEASRKFKRDEIIYSMFFNNNVIELEIKKMENIGEILK